MLVIWSSWGDTAVPDLELGEEGACVLGPTSLGWCFHHAELGLGGMPPILFVLGASLVTQTVKNLPAMWEPWVRPQGGEDPLEKGMATHSSILAWRIPRTEEPGGLQSMDWQRVGCD